MNETLSSVVSQRVYVGECLACVFYVVEVLNGDGIVRHIRNCMSRSHLFDFLSFDILCSHEFVGKLNVIDCNTRLWFVERTDVCFSHSPSLSFLPPT